MGVAPWNVVDRRGEVVLVVFAGVASSLRMSDEARKFVGKVILSRWYIRRAVVSRLLRRVNRSLRGSGSPKIVGLSKSLAEEIRPAGGPGISAAVSAMP
ncbi:hypothetical protein KM043_010256 [Ampulex compressa]|nr:hypothetical protein KM043_010256 [Ampulex compressa]